MKGNREGVRRNAVLVARSKSAVHGKQVFLAPFARNPLKSPDPRKFFATFGSDWKVFEAPAEGN